MIDVLVNCDGAMVVVHDERRLDGCLEAVVSRSNREIQLVGDFGERVIGILEHSMMASLNASRPGLCVRMSRWSLAKSEGIKVRLVD